MKNLSNDDLWAIVAPFPPKHRPHPKGGLPFVADRAALIGMVVVLRRGILWTTPPLEVGCGAGVTCWRRLRDWHQGVRK